MSYPANEPLRCDVKILMFDDVNVEALLNALGTEKFNELFDHIAEHHSTDLLQRIYNKDQHEIKDFLKDKIIK